MGGAEDQGWGLRYTWRTLGYLYLHGPFRGSFSHKLHIHLILTLDVRALAAWQSQELSEAYQ